MEVTLSQKLYMCNCSIFYIDRYMEQMRSEHVNSVLEDEFGANFGDLERFSD